MSLTASTTSRIARTVGQAVPRKRPARSLLPRKPLKRDPDTGLPTPHVNVIVQDTRPSRLGDHWHNTVKDDIMYMTYKHSVTAPKAPREIRQAYDPEDPYTKHRHNPVVGGMRWMRKELPLVTPESIIELDRIQIHCFLKEAVQSRSHLLGLIMAFRALSGESERAGGRRTAEGVQIVRGRKSVQSWIRKGLPSGVKVDLKGPKMYEFLGTLVDFVLPRLREFPGLVMPGQSALLTSPSAASGVVSMGLSPVAMSLFPQIEYNMDAYPSTYGMHIHFITKQRGEGAQNRVRALLSGFQVPFIRA